MSDPINPSHYKHLPAEAIDIIEAAIEGAPSPQAAAAQSHLLGYALRANQKGQLAIDAGKAEWYAARWLKAIREAEAKASGANETPIEPCGKTDQDDHAHDLKVGDAVISWQGVEGVIEAINLIDDFPITVRHSIREQVSYKIGGVKKKHDDHPRDKTPIAPPKRYREPTQADLKNGPIECEVGDRHEKRTLIYVFQNEPGRARFATVDKEMPGCVGRWIDCRIEVAE